MDIQFSNNGHSTLAASISSSDTSVTVASGHGARFPSLAGSQYFYATLIDASNNLEIVKVTARSSDVLTITRAQESTTARAYAIGDRIELRATAAGFNAIYTEAVADASPAANTIGADELNVSGNGTSGQYLSSDGDGSFSWDTVDLTSLNATNLTSGEVPYARFPAGTVIQVQSKSHATAATFNGSGGNTDITGYNISITPRYSNSKILICGHLSHNSTSVTYKLGIKRNGTKIQAGTASGSRQTALVGLGLNNDANQARCAGWWAIDTPGTTSAITYQMFCMSDNNNTLSVNRSPADSNSATGGRHLSNIVAWEIAQ